MAFLVFFNSELGAKSWNRDDLLAVATAICDRQDAGEKASAIYRDVKSKLPVGTDVGDAMLPFLAAETLCPEHRPT